VAQLILDPIGIVRSPFTERVEAPRQGLVRPDAAGVIELLAGKGFEDALADLSGFSHIWVLFWFDRNLGWRPKVRPPRSEIKRGLFATRSPYRPNPIGMSLVMLDSVVGLKLNVHGLDVLDGTPVLDIKPYVAYADSPHPIPSLDAPTSWLQSSPAIDDPRQHEVTFRPRAQEQLTFLQECGFDLAAILTQNLKLGPTPHAYRRIRVEGEFSVVAHKDWRARFKVDGLKIQVFSIGTGYRPSQMSSGVAPVLHRQFVEHFGYPGHG